MIFSSSSCSTASLSRYVGFEPVLVVQSERPSFAGGSSSLVFTATSCNSFSLVFATDCWMIYISGCRIRDIITTFGLLPARAVLQRRHPCDSPVQSASAQRRLCWLQHRVCHVPCTHGPVPTRRWEARGAVFPTTPCFETCQPNGAPRIHASGTSGRRHTHCVASFCTHLYGETVGSA